MRKIHFALAATLLSVSLTGIGAGWTVAWLTSETKSAKNIFTAGTVRIQLTETRNTDTDSDGTPDIWQGILIPGTGLHKNPQVSVPRDSEDSWIFVQLQESEWPGESSADSPIRYTLEDGWRPLPDHDGIYFQTADRKSPVRTFPVLRQDQVFVGADLTKQKLASMGQPKLIITAYAVQRAGFDSPEDAWKQLFPTA